MFCMSGHSKWSTIKRQKEATDIAKGKIFSKLSKAISIAVKTGGSDDPAMNSKLRVAIDQAKASNMPKANIERAISKASEHKDLEEVTYEGFGPDGVAVIVEAATDNRNRTSQAIKSIFDRGGGSMAGPGAVKFNFETKGYLAVEKNGDTDEQMLALIDAGAQDVEEDDSILEVYVDASHLHDVKTKIEDLGFIVKEFELIQKPKVLQKIDNKEKGEKVINLLEKLSDHDDVQKVFANADIQIN